MFFSTVPLAALCLTIALCVDSVLSNTPYITLDNGTFIGINNGSIDMFLGIPFAKPPVGDLRFRLPLANEPYTGVHNATIVGTPCVQQRLKVDIPDILAPDAKAFAEAYLESVNFDGGEDCLTVNVWRPASMSVDTKLPVVVYIYGGGFEVGESMDGVTVVERSVAIGEPIIYVNLNYRLSALGWLGGAEVKAAGVGNIGLHDQREALRWVQKYISSFNGDPHRVTIWGQSAGAISVALQMLVNDGDTEGLFHAAFMESGSAIPVGDITNGQKVYDTFVRDAGCQGISDTLQCLRQAPFGRIKKAMDESASFLSTSSLNLAWTPRVDGTFLRDLPQKALLNGKVATIPFISGNCDDEGTIFSLVLTNISSDDAFRSYIHSNYFPKASRSELDKLLAAYPSDVTLGSPFDTGAENAVTPEYKRLAAIQGDFTFFAPRRLFLHSLASRQDAWVYLWKKSKALADLGSAHGFDLDDIYGPGDLTDYVIHFINHGNPNGHQKNDTEVTNWPRYTLHNPQLLTLLDGAIPIGVGTDSFREEPIRVMTELSLKYPL